MQFFKKWGPIIFIFLLIILAWYITLALGLVPAYSRDPLGVGVRLYFGKGDDASLLQIFE